MPAPPRPAASQPPDGAAELRRARDDGRRLFCAVFIFSIFVNLLMLTGPLFMLQIYDRVLSSRSEETLIALLLLVAFLYMMMGILDHARGRIAARAGARFQHTLDRRVFDAALVRLTARPSDRLALGAQGDLEAIQRLLTSPTFLAAFDIPWTPIFITAIFIFHPLLGVLAVMGSVILIAIAIANQRATRRPTAHANAAARDSDRLDEQLKSRSGVVQAMGMREAGCERWQGTRRTALSQTLALSDRSGVFTTLARSFRLFLQSAMLAAGAWLVLRDQLTPGAMIATSILLGRALAPMDAAIGQWGTIQRAQDGWGKLVELLSSVPQARQRTALPRPQAHLEARQITVTPPGEHRPAIRMVSFALEPGTALGIIGPSGAGKSTLARAVTGVWRPAGGQLRLGGATLDQYDPDMLGRYLGYLPQRIPLFDGTIAQNIARLRDDRDDAKIVSAARKAGAHDMIISLPDGYDTLVNPQGGRLSGGQIQRIGLARALYGDPVILILDEPNSNLDSEGSNALNAAIRLLKSEGKSILIMAHRPAAIQECDAVLVLEQGARTALGPRDEVLRAMVRNHTDLLRDAGPGGVQ